MKLLKVLAVAAVVVAVGVGIYKMCTKKAEAQEEVVAESTALLQGPEPRFPEGERELSAAAKAGLDAIDELFKKTRAENPEEFDDEY